MMEKKHQLVAWTENICDDEKARLYMVPSLRSEVQASLFDDLVRIHREVHRSGGRVSENLARRAIRAYEKMSRFELFTGNIRGAIRYLFFAAQYCIWEDDCNWTYYGTDLGSYSYFCGVLRHEFVRLCEEGIRLAKNWQCEEVLQEKKPRQMLELYYEHTREERDLKAHLKN